MKINSKRTKPFTILFACLWIGIAGLTVSAQNDRPVLGRPEHTNPTPPPVNNDRPDRKLRPRVNRTPKPKSAVPTGKPLEFYVRKGSELIDGGDFELASQYFDEADKKRKDRGVTPELVELLDKQIQVTKLHIETAELEDAEKALANYQEILKLRPNDPKAKEQLPALYLKLGDNALSDKDFPRAVDYFSQYATLSPEDQQVRQKLVESLVGRGEAELAGGKQDQAQNTFKRVLELEPKNQLAQTRLQALDLIGLVEFAENKLKSGAYEDALSKFKEVLALDPNNERAKQGLPVAQGNYLKLKATQLYNNRLYADSEGAYKEALTYLPEDDEIKRRLGELVLRLSPPVAAKGKATWRGKVNGSVKIAIKGRELSYPEGDASDGAISERLPDVSYLIKRVKRLTGDATVRIAEQPTAANGYTTIIAVDAKKSDSLSFDIEWELKRMGSITWKGQVAGRSLIRVQGPFIDLEQVSGEAAKEISFQGEALPRQDTLVKVRRINGKSDVRLVETPSQANSYIATIAVEGADTESEQLSFELNWQLK